MRADRGAARRPGAHASTRADRRRALDALPRVVECRSSAQRGRTRRAERRRHGAEVVPGTFSTKEEFENDYLIDRADQAKSSFTGIKSIVAQDLAVTQDQGGYGTIADRSREYLTSSDKAIIALRKRLLTSAKALMQGTNRPNRATRRRIAFVPATSSCRGRRPLPRERKTCCSQRYDEPRVTARRRGSCAARARVSALRSRRRSCRSRPRVRRRRSPCARRVRSG